MIYTTDHKLKVGFRNLFPEYAQKLDLAQSQQEIDTLHEDFKAECRKNLTKAIQDSNLSKD